MTGRLARLGLLLLAVVVLGVAGSRVGGFIDLTSDKTLSLTDETKRVLDAVHADVKVHAFLARDEPGFAEAHALLDRYRRENRHVSYSVRDPRSSPGEVRRLGVDASTGAVAVTMGDKVQVVQTASEQDVTAAIARLVRGTSPLVCVTTGHGELDPDAPGQDGMTRFAASLRDNGYRLRRLDLLADPAVPSDCRAVVLARPMSPLGPADATLAEYLRNGGRALVLTDPVSNVELMPILDPWGLGVHRGVVFEGDVHARFPGDETAPIVSRYSSGNPIVRRLPPTYFPGTQQVTVDEDRFAPGLTVSRLADTTRLSYLETAPVEARFDPADDVPGPITVAAAADRSRVSGETITRTRLVVLGDADLATDVYVGEAANGRLLVQALDWLTLDENLVAVSAHLPEDRPLRLTDARSRYARFLTAGVVPALFLLAGAMVWAVRRSR